MIKKIIQKLFGFTEQEHPADLKISAQQIEVIVQRYGEVLGMLPRDRYPAGVFPESLLPYPKYIIEKCLKTAINIATDQNMKDALNTGLLFLPDFIDDHEAFCKNGEIALTLTRAETVLHAK